MDLLLGDVLGDWSLGLSWLGLLGFVDLLLLLDFLDVSVLDVLLGSLNGLISGGSILASLSLDFLETHADHGLLDSGGLSSSLLLDVVNSDFLILSSPGLGPGQLDWLDILVIKGSSFGANEISGLSILTSELGASTWPDSHLRVGAGISLNNHLSESK